MDVPVLQEARVCVDESENESDESSGEAQEFLDILKENMDQNGGSKEFFKQIPWFRYTHAS